MNRIKRLEQRQEADEPGADIVYVYDSKSATKTEAARQQAIAEYKTKHPDWKPSHNDLYIGVLNKHSKELTERVIAGERTG